MDISTTWFKDKYNILIYGVLITCSVLAALLAVQNIKISPDSMRFGLVSQQILSGNGIRVPIIRLEDNFVPVDGAVPFLDQMPLLPILFALLGSVTPQNYLPAQFLNVVCHVATSLFTFSLMRSLYNNRRIALLTAILVTFAYPLLWNVNHILNEPLFIALLVASIYFLLMSRYSDSYKFNRNLFIAGICASAAIFTRNTGIALIPIFLWEMLIILKNKRVQTKKIHIILPMLLPVITTVTMLIRNYVVAGTLRGYKQSSPERSYIEAVQGTLNMIFEQFMLGKNAIVFIAAFMTIFISILFINAQLRKDLSKHLNSGLDSIMLFIFSYIMLICVAMAKQAWNFELRYVSPLVPFFFIVTVFIVVFIWDRITVPKLPLIGMLLFFALIVLGNFYKTSLKLTEFSYKQEKVYSILHSCTYNWIKNNYKKNIVIATNRPYHLSFFGGYSTIALPHKRFDPTINVPDDMKVVLPRQMSKFESHVIALFEKSDEKYEGSYISELFNNREDNKAFLLMHNCSDGVVYEMREQD